jgi:hypothetical protein
MQPHLAFNYSSTRTDGMLGIGWSLGGLSRITRCAEIFDGGGPAPVTLTYDDRLCLDGQRLIRGPGPLPDIGQATYLAPTRTHYTELETFQAIAALGPEYEGSRDGPRYVGPAAFKVWTKDGLILTYGRWDVESSNAAWGMATHDRQRGDHAGRESGVVPLASSRP